MQAARGGPIPLHPPDAGLWGGKVKTRKSARDVQGHKSRCGNFTPCLFINVHICAEKPGRVSASVSTVVYAGRCRSRLHSPCLGFAQMQVAWEINAQGRLQEPTRGAGLFCFPDCWPQRRADGEQKPPGCVEGSRTQASQADSGLTLLRALILL